MPTISCFYGIIIVMYLRNKEHNPPHIHAITQDFAAPFLIETGEIMEGDFPSKPRAMVKEFILKYQKELKEMWGDGTICKTPTIEVMFHKATNVEFKEGTVLELTFKDGKVKSFDMSVLFEKYPQLRALRDRTLFCAGKLTSPYGIVWNDKLDIEAETIYEEGMLVRTQKAAPNLQAGEAVYSARARAGLSQTDLSAATGIDQSDISKIERGIANPSISTLNRIADALNCELQISIIPSL